MQISNTDTAAIVVNFYVQIAGTDVDVLVGSVSAAAGTTTDCRNTVALAGLFQHDVNGNRVHYMQKNHTWKVAAVTRTGGGEHVGYLRCDGEVLMIRPPVFLRALTAPHLTEAVPGVCCGVG